MASPTTIVLAALEDTFYFPPEIITGRKRNADLTFVRQLGMLALIEQFSTSAEIAAQAFNRTDPDTARHAVQRVKSKTTCNTYLRAKTKQFLLSLAHQRRLAN